MNPRGTALIFFFATISCALRGWAVENPIVLELSVPSEVSITSSNNDFTLKFTDFNKGSQSSTEVVTYRIRANNMGPGHLLGTLSVRLTEPFEYARLEATVADFKNQAEEAGFSSLQPSQPGFCTIGTELTSLADKQPGQGQWDACLDGYLSVSWKATLTRDAPAREESRALIITLKDVD